MLGAPGAMCWARPWGGTCCIAVEKGPDLAQRDRRYRTDFAAANSRISALLTPQEWTLSDYARYTLGRVPERVIGNVGVQICPGAH
jgi:hypothetical protein